MKKMEKRNTNRRKKDVIVDYGVMHANQWPRLYRIREEGGGGGVGKGK